MQAIIPTTQTNEHSPEPRTDRDDPDGGGVTPSPLPLEPIKEEECLTALHLFVIGIGQAARLHVGPLDLPKLMGPRKRFGKCKNKYAMGTASKPLKADKLDGR